MHLGRAVSTAVAAIAAGQQAEQLLPTNFCTPECPQCKDAVTNPFDTNTSCIPTSRFMVNCGSCQTCLWTYAIENPGAPDMSSLEAGVQYMLDMCLNTTANEEVMELASQVSRISELGNMLASSYPPTTTYSQFTTTETGGSTTWTLTGDTGIANYDPSWTTILSTATWASEYYSRVSAEASAISLAANSDYNQTATAVVDGGGLTATAAPIAPTQAPPAATVEKQPTNNNNWLIGPVIGAILGLTTIVTGIYFIRRKLLRAALAREQLENQAREKEEGDDSGESQLGHVELENTEVHELAAPEPVGSELSTPRDGHMDPIEEWPLPLSPLTQLFAMTELRDKRAEENGSLKHDTYYNP